AAGLVAAAGTRVIGNACGDVADEFDIELVEQLEPGYVTEWVNGLDSLREALADPEVVEEDDE
ncbi:MAG: DUF2150 family protein, partial [Halobacteriaceae archaeon]